MLEITTPATKKWKLHEISNVVDCIENKIIEKTTETPIPYIQDYRNVILDIACKSIETIREVILLCADGYPDGALSLARNLYEQLIIIEFFRTTKRESDIQVYIEDYYLDFDYQTYKNRKLEDKYFGLQKGEKEKNKKLFKRIKALAHNDIKKGIYWWTGQESFSSLVNYVNTRIDDSFRPLFNELHLEYKRACLSVHSNSYGNAVRLGSKEELYYIDNTPKICGQGLPLWFATISFIDVVGTICDELDIDYEGLFKKELHNLAVYFKKQALKEEKS